eukprot:symbB.v1.2.028268.t1/scaffold2983.1/size65930/4
MTQKIQPSHDFLQKSIENNTKIAREWRFIWICPGGLKSRSCGLTMGKEKRAKRPDHLPRSKTSGPVVIALETTPVIVPEVVAARGLRSGQPVQRAPAPQETRLRLIGSNCH